MGQNPSGGMVDGGNLATSGLLFRIDFQRTFDALAAQPEEQFMQEFFTPDTEEIEWDWLDEMPGLKEWIGPRYLSELKAFAYRTKTKQWARGIRIKVNDLKRDKLALVQMRIQRFAQVARRHYANRFAVKWKAGFGSTEGLCFDGQFFFDSDHDFGSNLATAVFSEAALYAAFTAKAAWVNTEGEYFGGTWTHLMHGPTLRSAVDKVVKSRIKNDSGAGVDNPMFEQVVPVQVPWLTGAYANYWGLFDQTAPLKGFGLQIEERIRSTQITGAVRGDGEDSLPRFERNEIYVGAEGKHDVPYLAPQAAYASNGTV